MIPRAFINEWRSNVLWQEDEQIEQDLILTRAIIQIFSDDFLRNSLAFRGGTALHKLFNLGQKRYSEDIDLVVIKEGPIGLIFDSIQKQINPWLGIPRRELKKSRANLYYKYKPENMVSESRRVKIEINTVESFHICDYERLTFNCDSQWFKGSAEVNTFNLNELLGTKLRALYQRKKGRDLFDLYFGLKNADVDATKVINIFLKYMDFSDCKVSRAQFEANMSDKIKDPVFREDISSLLVREKNFDIDQAYLDISSILFTKLPGEPWKGK